MTDANAQNGYNRTQSGDPRFAEYAFSKRLLHLLGTKIGFLFAAILLTLGSTEEAFFMIAMVFEWVFVLPICVRFIFRGAGFWYGLAGWFLCNFLINVIAIALVIVLDSVA